MQREIKFIVVARRWFDKVNGNTYHSARIARCSDGAVLLVPFQYGYGDMYRQTSLLAMSEAGWLPEKYRSGGGFAPFKFERENNYPIQWEVSDGLKRDCVNNGRD